MVNIPEEFVRPYSFAAKTAHLRSTDRVSRAGAMHLDGSETAPAVFAENEILVSSEYPEAVEYLVERLGGTMIPPRPLPPPPARLARSGRRPSEADAPTHSIKVSFTEPPEVPDAVNLLGQITDRASVRGRLTFSSTMAASVSVAALSLGLPDGSVGLNHLADPTALPLDTIREDVKKPPGPDPMQWQPFVTRSRIVDAWQLVDSYRLAGTDTSFTMLAIMDNGFWVDSTGAPLIPSGQSASDFDRGFLAINAADDSRNIGGRSAKGWHGTKTASAAAATVDNGRGAAGSGGSVAWPLLMKADDLDAIMRGIRICAAWGIDVVNMSFGITTTVWEGLFFPDTDWVNAFQFAADNGVVMIASAGNDGKELPDEWIRPATRTPGVLTVGALDKDNVSAADWSNYGSSVALWAPGTKIPVMPDGDNPRGSRPSGTSFSAPLVAGTAAMMRAVAPSLSNSDVGRLLIDSGWDGQGRVTKGLDAYAAVKAALNSQLPDWFDAGDDPSAAEPLIEVRPGVFAPRWDSLSAARNDHDIDFWSLQLDEYTSVAITVDYYDRIADLFLDVIDSSGDSVVGVEDTDGDRFEITYGDGVIRGRGVLPDGKYLVRVRAIGLTAYNLEVACTAEPLEVDRFEPNNSFDTATPLRFVRTPLDIYLGHGPGVFALTLHRQLIASPTFPNNVTVVVDSDYFWFPVPRADGKRVPLVTITSDKPVTATLYDDGRRELQRHESRRSITLRPPERTNCYLKISASEQTRYVLGITMTADPRIQIADLPTYEVLPPWWAIRDPIPWPDPTMHFGVELAAEPPSFGTLIGESISVAADGLAELPVTAELLDRDGTVVAVGKRDGFGRLDIPTASLEPGMYAVRLTRPAEEPIGDLRLTTPLWAPG
ncbi:subtilisin-like serine protease [Mycolicibacterium chubuense NBB4]|uniref:Subtilisin-like serine protease n=1 Tax=Mycolicibacterium chubuense (strain NBB4) TaxID=710421 RepID=I4BEE1_MYCCN|nr:S8/S53 family peptidase [Mycolicibacterium chubuense]AFM15648.1 subtilisin-like serine protease [Mycolicibacterium chubuense NBB4]